MREWTNEWMNATGHSDKTVAKGNPEGAITSWASSGATVRRDFVWAFPPTQLNLIQLTCTDSALCQALDWEPAMQREGWRRHGCCPSEMGSAQGSCSLPRSEGYSLSSLLCQRIHSFFHFQRPGHLLWAAQGTRNSRGLGKNCSLAGVGDTGHIQ